MVVMISLDGFPAYALQDDRLPAPALRELAQSGAVAAGMTTVNPTVTWPNHTTLVTGVDPDQHHVLFNGQVLHNGSNSPVTVNESPNEKDVVKAETIYDLAQKAGLITAQVAWPAATGSPAIRWSFAETPDAEGEIARELVEQGICTHEQLEHFGGSDAWRDEIYADAAVDILKRHRPDLLLLHFSASDMVQHQYGPHSRAADTVYAFEDDRVRQVLDALRTLNLLPTTTVLVVSDHGFRVTHHEINLNALFVQKGLAGPEGKHPTAQVWSLPHGGVAMVYVSDPAKKEELIPKLKVLLAGVEGVGHVYTGPEFAAYGLPAQSQTDQSPDLFLTARTDYYFEEKTSGPVVHDVARSGEHGYLATDSDMDAIFIASGDGIRKGLHLQVIPNIDVAPTIAVLLGLSPEHMQGKPLVQILDRPH
jgi:predicted AlkP superfamily pyrophosphatase or phosphodiesterase